MPMYLPPPPSCPECNKAEDIKQVCRHCEYEYPESGSDGKFEAWIALACLIGAVIGAVFFADSFTYEEPHFMDYFFAFVVGGLGTGLGLLLLGGIIWMFGTLFERS